MNRSTNIITKKLPADLITPTGATRALEQKYDECFLIESVEENKYKGRYSVIGLLPDKRFIVQNEKITISQAGKQKEYLIADGHNPLTLLETELANSALPNNNSLSPYNAGWFGYFGYDMVQYMEKIKLPNKRILNIPDCLLIRPQIIIVFDNISDEITISAPLYEKKSNEEIQQKEKLIQQIEEEILANYNSKNDASKDGEEIVLDIDIQAETSDLEYQEYVKEAIEYIKSGDVFQIVPSRRFTSNFPYKPLSFYRALRSINPSPFLFYFNFSNFTLAGSSPEIMVRVADDTVTIRPLAGTKKRGKDEKEDKKIAQELLNDKKEIAEHLMLLDLGRNDVGRVALPGSVKVTQKMVVEKYSHVMHISSTVEGKLAKDSKLTDALAAGFPAGTVSGAPKIRAMEILTQLEKYNREFYAGCVGYFSNLSKNMDMAITLRTALIKDKKIHIQSGAGVVFDSNPQSEADETTNKAQALFNAAKQSKFYR